MIENALVRVGVNPDGAIRSFVNKRAGDTELTRKIAGSYLNDLAPDSDAGEPLVVTHRGPVSVTLRARSDAGLAHTTWVTLYRDSDRVDVRNEISDNFSDVRYWSFGFGLDSPAVHSEEVGAINLDKLKSDGGDYALINARYDHVTLNHFADISNGTNTSGVTLSNSDLAFMKLGESTIPKLDTTTPQINVLAGGQVDGPWLGIRDQNGNSHFLQRFALRAHGAYDPVEAMKFAVEHQNPLACGPVISKGDHAYPPDTYSLFRVTNPNVLLWTVKPAEEGIDQGVIVRLWNAGDARSDAAIHTSSRLSAAVRTSHVETDIENVPLDAHGDVNADLAAQQIQTFRLMIQR